MAGISGCVVSFPLNRAGLQRNLALPLSGNSQQMLKAQLKTVDYFTS